MADLVVADDNVYVVGEKIRELVEKRIGYCCRCGKCCNINSFSKGTMTIRTVREDGSCGFLIRGNDCLKHVTVKGKPLGCKEFPKKASDIALIPECTYSFVEED